MAPIVAGASCCVDADAGDAERVARVSCRFRKRAGGPFDFPTKASDMSIMRPPELVVSLFGGFAGTEAGGGAGTVAAGGKGTKAAGGGGTDARGTAEVLMPTNL